MNFPWVELKLMISLAFVSIRFDGLYLEDRHTLSVWSTRIERLKSNRLNLVKRLTQQKKNINLGRPELQFSSTREKFDVDPGRKTKVVKTLKFTPKA